MASTVRATLIIGNRLGLHARAAAKLSKLASGFASEVHLSRSGRRVNAKSIMGVMMLAAGCGSQVELEVDGTDAEAAATAIQALVADRFGEGG
jgi:phosphocarrier protein